jgi:5-methylcytosine-specific restriction protein A
MRWSVGNVTSIVPGDRLFLIRLGSEPRGIIGSGWATTAPYRALHWDPARAAHGDMTNTINLDLECLEKEPLVPLDVLNSADVLSGYHWSTQMSGVLIPDEVAAVLEDVWASTSGSDDTGFADEHATPVHFVEGAAVRVYVNQYERNPAARSRCVAHYGRKCAVCGMTFGDTYGSDAARLIEVHHLDPLGGAGGEHPVDPIKDMRPLCPNCHAVVHLKSPPISIDQARAMLRAAQGRPISASS